MPDFNSVTLMGRLTRDPQLKFLPNQTAVCEFSLAVGRKFKAANGEMREDTGFFDCAIFGKGGEVINQYMSKGKPLFVTGRLKQDTWEDKNGGGKRSKISVVVEQFQFIGGPPGAGGGEQGRSPADPQRHGDDGGSQVPPGIDDDEIPF